MFRLRIILFLTLYTEQVIIFGGRTLNNKILSDLWSIQPEGLTARKVRNFLL